MFIVMEANVWHAGDKRVLETNTLVPGDKRVQTRVQTLAIYMYTGNVIMHMYI